MSREVLEKIVELERRHIEWRSNCLNMIAAENIASPSVRNRLPTDFGCRYVNTVGPALATNWATYEEGKVYEGLDHIVEVEKICQKLLQQLFRAKYADYRPLSGSAAILGNWAALTDVGDVIVTTDIESGGHGEGWDDAAILMGRKIEHWPFDSKEFTIDLEAAKKKIKRIKPKLLVFGASRILFPAPIRELKDVADNVGAYCTYDGSHVLGLIAGRRFQDPLREGVITLFGSIHKTFPGPQGGVVLSNADEDVLKRLDIAMVPSLFDNYHQNRVAALAVAAAEMIEYGEKYADQIIRNAKALGQALNDEGFTVVASHKGFTETHQILLDVRPTGRGGIESAKALASCNIIANRGFLAGDRKERKSGAVRFGVSELTRIGMKESTMADVARLIRKCLLDNVSPATVKQEVIQLRQQYNRLEFSFDQGLPPY
jgi:glycine hydroxymethyltransferase